jgi:hypothetical protein
MIFKKYLKDALSTIAVNTTIFILGCLFFGSIALFGILSEFFRDEENPTRTEHLRQHDEEQVKYDEMIRLLDSIHTRLE